jgi:hypothetical protein
MRRALISRGQFADFCLKACEKVVSDERADLLELGRVLEQGSEKELPN